MQAGVEQNGLAPESAGERSREQGGIIEAILFGIIGGLGLFMFGIHLMSEGLQKAAGDKIKRGLATLTSRPIYGLFLGTIVTAIVQSSSASTVMVVGIVNAGLLEFAGSMGIILGCNIGNAVTAQIVALKIEHYALPAIGIGMVLYIFFKSTGSKNIGMILLGFGMLFLGITFMKDAIPPGAQVFIRKLFLMSGAGFKGTLIGLAVGTVATIIVQTSGVTVSLIVILALQGLVTDLSGVIPLILGCNIGTCVTALIASMGTNTDSKRVAVAHTFFNVIAAVVTLVAFYPVYLRFIPRIGGNMAHQVANVHLAIKLVSAIVFLPFAVPFSRLIAWIMPGKVEERPAIEEPQYLRERFIKTPAVAIELAIKEIVRLGEICRNMIKYAMDGFMYNDEVLLNHVEEYSKAVHGLQTAISRYVIEISQQVLSEEEAEMVPKLILSVNNFDRVAGYATRLLDMGRIKVSKDIPLVGSALNELKNIYREVDVMLTEVSGYLPGFKR